MRPGTWIVFMGRLGAEENGMNGVPGTVVLRKRVFSLFCVQDWERFTR